ncbi:MAG: DUF2149 domain-containing protein [Planctomycetaceae bacterium]|nr:DUF2149 domain-containing protein [Planctomycetaceae bacterium]
MAKSRKNRPWRIAQDEDPLGGMVNLSDLWIVVIVALMLVLVQATARSQRSVTAKGTDGEQVPEEQMVKLERFRELPTELTGRGVRLGTAYRLENGEVVYASESSHPVRPNASK